VKSINRKDFIVAGTVAKTHGTKGELKIITDIKVKLTGWAFLEIREKPVPFYVQRSVSGTPDEWLLKLQDIDSVEQAQQYIGYPLLVPKQKGKRLATQGDFNLEGFLLVDRAIGEIGAIVATEQLPKQTMLVTHYHGQQVMIPLVEEFIEGVDEEKEIIYLNLPEGFFALYE
jgi:16S rRNA processing protein RimM